jgi:hypothetical protein
LFWNSSIDLAHLSDMFSIFFLHQNDEPDHVQILPLLDKTTATNSARTGAPPPSLLRHQTRLVLQNLLVRSPLPRSPSPGRSSLRPEHTCQDV